MKFPIPQTPFCGEIDNGERSPQDGAILRAQRFLACATDAPEPFKTTLIFDATKELRANFDIDTPRTRTSGTSRRTIRHIGRRTSVSK